jgi:hemolysin III
MISENNPEGVRIPFVRFFLAIGTQLAAFVLLFALVAPHAFSAEIHKPWTLILGIFAFGLPLSLFEYLYHRYLLHSAILPFMASMHRAHGAHHGLTTVKAPVRRDEPYELVPVTSEFPIVEEHQQESMMFPLWSFPIFVGVFGILLALPFKLLFPAQPMLLAVLGSVTAYYCSYEVWHAILHLPYERFWKPMTEGRYTKRPFRLMYSFHLMHHWRPTCNLAIVGLWGVAVWDHAFRTHRRPERMPLHQSKVTYQDAVLPKPLWPISQFDRWQGRLFKGSRRFEKWLAAIFLGRRTPASVPNRPPGSLPEED